MNQKYSKIKKEKMINIEKTYRKCSSRKRGFSLVEVLVAMFVFVLVMTMLSGSFAGFLKNYANTKMSQKSVENAQFVMNQMEQAFLNSSYVEIVSGNRINLYSTTDGTGKCVVYMENDANDDLLYSSADPSTADDPTSCDWTVVPAEVLIDGTLFGFNVSGDQVKITLVFKIKEVGQREETTIQSTALSRNAWINNSACPGVSVLANDVAGTHEYRDPRDACSTPQCGIDGGQLDKLVADNTQSFILYPARQQCQKLGGRLPDRAELTCILQNRSVYGGFGNNRDYWTSEERNAPRAYFIRNDGTPNSDDERKDDLFRVRCVK